MNQMSIEYCEFLNALTLAERARTLKELVPQRKDCDVNIALAERRIQQWRVQPPFTNSEYFQKRLEADHLTDDVFLQLLGEPSKELLNRLPEYPSWLVELNRSFSQSSSSNSDNNQIKQELNSKGFLNLIEPLIKQGREQLKQGIKELKERYPTIPFNPTTVDDLFIPGLLNSLGARMLRTMVLELNVARINGSLQGETGAERFAEFLESLRTQEVATTILREYPVLARLLTVCINDWVKYSLEFLGHLCADWPSILSTLLPEADPGHLVSIEGSAGDTHRQGRSVIIAKFESGFQIVYKPHSLSVDIHFGELLTWLNERGDHPFFKALRIIDRGTYGWAEFIHASGCESIEELQRFYKRLGGYLALLYSLEATDFHYENLIAAGEHPYLIDLEALFHPRVSGVDAKHKLHSLAVDTIGHSVLRIGLLPQRIWSNAEHEGVDLSGLAGASGQLSPYKVMALEAQGTDEMHLVRKRVKMPGKQNRPSLNNSDVNVQDYTGEIIEGFKSIYNLILKYREDLLASDGPLNKFAYDEVRAVLRPTQIYSLLLNESYHPDVLRNALDRDRLLDRLWVGIEQRPYLSKVIPYEHIDLHRGDIPIFTTRPNSRDLWTSTDDVIENFFDEPSLVLTRRRVESLNEDALSRQIWFIQASIATLSKGKNISKWNRYDSIDSPTEMVDRERLLSVARAIGDRLDVLGLHDDNTVTWVGVSLVDEKVWSLVPVGGDIYNGNAGIALFLAYLGALTKEDHYKMLSRKAIQPLVQQIEDTRDQSSLFGPVGGYTGWGSLIYSLTHLAILLNEPELLSSAELLVDRLPELIKEDKYLDVISGAAGCLGALLVLYSCSKNPRTLAAAIACGDRLIETAQQMDQGIGWNTPVQSPKPLTGFSHGAAGMAWALLELFAATGEVRFKAAALEAIHYENSLFLPEEGNWPDYRELDGLDHQGPTPPTFIGWCHGAPGIGLARLRALAHIDNTQIRADIDAAISTTLKYGFGINHSLCHGDLGNLELIIEASKTLNNSHIHQELSRITSKILNSIDRDGWICGIPLGVETPGFMTGLAGIGYGLLRLADPFNIPSVLMLEGPQSLKINQK
jgi:type 2 lantibiotic biosynthesis protein LanM